MDRINIWFYYSVGNFPCFIQDWKIKSSGLQIDLPHSFNKRMLIISWPWALLGSRLLINVAISPQEKLISEIDLSVFLRRFKGSSLELSVLEHCLAKNKLNNSAFFFKSVTYLLSWGKVGIQGNFFVWKYYFGHTTL